MIAGLRMWIIPFFVLFWFAIMLKIAGRNREKNMDDFRDLEQEANSARRKDIDPALFFTPVMDALPAISPDDRLAAKAADYASKTMLYFPQPMSNTDLKMTYGPGQLENIAQYEENYQIFIRILIEWAEGLIKEGKNKDALQVLEYTVKMGSEYRKSYMLAVDLYNDDEKINELRKTVEAHHFKDPHVKQSILKYIDRTN